MNFQNLYCSMLLFTQIKSETLKKFSIQLEILNFLLQICKPSICKIKLYSKINNHFIWIYFHLLIIQAINKKVLFNLNLFFSQYQFLIKNLIIILL